MDSIEVHECNDIKTEIANNCDWWPPMNLRQYFSQSHLRYPRLFNEGSNTPEEVQSPLINGASLQDPLARALAVQLTINLPEALEQ